MKYRYTTGFTLLEMLVVLLLVGMLSAVLMQGFIYMAGIYSAVERRQQVLSQQQLLDGWFRDSVAGLVSGITRHSTLAESAEFNGKLDTWSGLSLSPLISKTAGVPHVIAWKIVVENGEASLSYAEAQSQTDLQWFELDRWQTESIYFSYLDHQGDWQAEFPKWKSGFSDDQQAILPAAIALSVDGIRYPVHSVARVYSNPYPYQEPSDSPL